MSAKTYNGYRITELRRYAREYAVAGRSKMTGDELLAAVVAVWDGRRKEQEQQLLDSVKVAPGALLRHKSNGDIIRVTSEVLTWAEVGGALYVEAEYVECDGWGPAQDRRLARAAYQNDSNARSGHVAKHPLWQYAAMLPEVKAGDAVRFPGTEVVYTVTSVGEVDRSIVLLEGDGPADGTAASLLGLEVLPVDLAKLTERIGLEPAAQQGVRTFVDEPGPWTEAEAVKLIEAWHEAYAKSVEDGTRGPDMPSTSIVHHPAFKRAQEIGKAERRRAAGCFHPRSCRACSVSDKACGGHVPGEVGHELCSGRA